MASEHGFPVMDLAELIGFAAALERQIREEVSKLSPQNLLATSAFIHELRVESERLRRLIRDEQDLQAQTNLQARALSYLGA